MMKEEKGAFLILRKRRQRFLAPWRDPLSFVREGKGRGGLNFEPGGDGLF